MSADPPRRLDRRRFFLRSAGMLGLAMSSATSSCSRGPRFSSYPFSLGVASGEPRPDGVVLWTRLAPEPLAGGGMSDQVVEVEWQVASDERMTNVVREGTATATALLAHTVHVEVEGLEPGRGYWYRFRAGSEISPVGRTRTAPALERPVDRVRFAFASCQHYEAGYFTAFRHMADEELDVVFHLGDYIYEGGVSEGRPRQHNSPEIQSLDDYRNRYALYKTDADLQAAHAAFPWVVTPDDHEVDNNYAAAISEKEDPAEEFLARRAVAYQAYYEHMPLRAGSIPNGPDMRLYRGLNYGDLVSFSVLDTRQYRSDQPCGDKRQPRCEGVFDPGATLLGAEQEQWLLGRLDASRATWNVLAQQVMMADVDRTPGDGETYSMDQWSGYEAAGKRLLSHFAERPSLNPIVLTGDIHSNWVNDLKLDFSDPKSPTAATEFVGTSISSGGNGGERGDYAAGIQADNPAVKFYNGQRGYVTCVAGKDEFQANYRVVPIVEEPGGPVETKASFAVAKDRPGAHRV